MLVLGSQNPLFELLSTLLCRHLSALVANIRIDISIDNNHLAIGLPGTNLRRHIRSIAGKKQCHDIWIYLLNATQFATQIACDKFAIDRRIKTRKMNIFALNSSGSKEFSQFTDLGRFSGSVKPFKYDKHIVRFLIYSLLYLNILTARATPCTSASISAIVL